jgi:predicted  nucleic acid-binding Zn-ribbon protein
MRQHARKTSPSLILSADKQTVLEASDKAEKGFDEEEKHVLDLIDVERKKLQDLEADMQELQPAITNKLKEVLEINMTLTSAKRGIDKAHHLMDMMHKKCDMVDHFLGEQAKSRHSVVDDVAMAAKLVEHMDTTLFLDRDIQNLKPAAPSLLQFSTSTENHDVAPVIPYSFLQDADTNSEGLQSLIESYSASMGMTEGPFDKVTKMISGLIASLKAQANEAVTQDQFCQTSMGENRNDRVAKANDIDALDTTIRWSQMAIVRLEDDLEYLENELKHVAEAADAESKALDKEQHRVDRELHEHQLSHEVMTKSVEILTQLCNLGSAAASSLIQQDNALHSTDRTSSRYDQCKQAADLLRSGLGELDHLDAVTNDYLIKYSQMSADIMQSAYATEDSIHSQIKTTKSSKAQRASELATANKDVKRAKQDLKLIETTKKEIEHQCSHVETREEKLAKRQDEIDALKEALSVLEGESVAA